MSGVTKFLFPWRLAIVSAEGPGNPTTRHVLLTLALHMNSDGQRCFPSEARLAAETGLSDRSVRTHLKIATENGWISRKRWRCKGKNWAQYCYCATLPKGLDAPEPRSVANQDAPERPSDGAEPESTLVRNNLPTNSTKNSTKNALQKKKPEGPAYQAFHKLAEQRSAATRRQPK